MKNITIKEIAKEANVSIATVSRVINQKGGVSEERTKAVEAAIAKLNYFPNNIARSLKNASTKTIALIVSDISNGYFAKLSLVIEQYFYERGFVVIVCSTNDNKDKEYNDISLLMEKKVDGFIINTTGKNDEFISRISNSVPVVLCNRRLINSNGNCDFVDSDNNESAYILTKKLLDSGHRDIGLINGPQSISSASERFEGFKRAMREINVDINDLYRSTFTAEYNEHSGYLGAKHLLSLAQKPTAILAMNGPMAIGALRYIREVGMSVPEDISLVSATDIVHQDLFYVDLTSGIMDPNQIGRRSSELLYERIIDKHKRKNVEVRFQPKFNWGKSVKDI